MSGCRMTNILMTVETKRVGEKKKIKIILQIYTHTKKRSNKKAERWDNNKVVGISMENNYEGKKEEKKRENQ